MILKTSVFINQRNTHYNSCIDIGNFLVHVHQSNLSSSNFSHTLCRMLLTPGSCESAHLGDLRIIHAEPDIVGVPHVAVVVTRVTRETKVNKNTIQSVPLVRTLHGG